MPMPNIISFVVRPAMEAVHTVFCSSRCWWWHSSGDIPVVKWGSVVRDGSKPCKAKERTFCNFVDVRFGSLQHHKSQIGLAAKHHTANLKGLFRTVNSQCLLTHMHTASNLFQQRGSSCAALKSTTWCGQSKAIKRHFFWDQVLSCQPPIDVNPGLLKSTIMV